MSIETPLTATIPVLAHPFNGLGVAETARLRLIPASPRPCFDQDVWDLSGLAEAPVVMSAHRKILDFTAIANPRWRQVARQYLMARLAPLHPAVSTLPHSFRTPLNPNSLWGELKRLTGWFNHLTAAGVSSLAQVEQRHCETYLAAASRSNSEPDRLLSPATIAAAVRPAQFLALYAEILTDTYRPGFTPWAGRTADDLAGYIRSGINQTPPIPDAVLGPLLASSMYLLKTIGPHLQAEATAVRAADRREAESRRGLLIGEIQALREVIEARRTAGLPAQRAAASTVTLRLAAGWDRDDPLLRMAWHPLVVEAAGAMGHRRDLEILRPHLQRWVRECGVLQPWCRDADLVTRDQGDELIPWALPMGRQQFDNMIYAAISAAFVLTSALTGMRSSELAELSAGCRHQEERPGGGNRFRLLTRRIKGQAFGGTQDAWVVIEDVHHAIGVAEALSGATDGQRLFSTASNNSNKRIQSLREWVNGPHGQRLGLQLIPAGPINPRALRRTLAMAIAQRPHGLMAAKVHLKHLSVAATEGYIHRPGGHQAAFIADVTAQENTEHLRLTVAAYEDYQRGILPTGQGARDLIATFRTVDQILDRHEPGPVTVIDDRRVERLLTAKAASLHVGVANYCWFTDPGKALCLHLAGTPDADRPLIGMCDSARCSQATHHPSHRQAWAEHAETTKTVFLGNPRLSKPERARAQATLERATRILTEIDTATDQSRTTP